MWLYKLTNKMNGKSYIGTSVNPVSQRVSRHLYAAKNGLDNCMAITRAIRKYGLKSFSVEIIGESINHEDLMNMEVAAIKAQNTLRPNGYNISIGGVGACRPCSKATAALISERLRAKKMIPWNFGKRNLRTIARYARIGNKGGQQAGAPSKKIGKHYGPLSVSHRQTISETMKKVRAERFWSSKKESI